MNIARMIDMERENGYVDIVHVSFVDKKGHSVGVKRLEFREMKDARYFDVYKAIQKCYKNAPQTIIKQYTLYQDGENNLVASIIACDINDI